MATNPDELIEAPPEAVEDVATPAEEAVAPETDAAEEEGAEGQPRDEKGKFAKDGVQKRIDELTRARREAERRAEFAERQLASVKAQIGTVEKPQKDQFADDDAYTEALAEYAAKTTFSKAQQEAAIQAQKAARDAAWEARTAEVKVSIPDYDTVVSGSTAPVLDHVVDALMESEQGPALVYHLAKNPDVVERLNSLSPARAAIELGRLEATLTAPVVKQPSNAPPPPSPLTAAPSIARDPSKMSTADYIAWRKSQPVRW